MIKFTFRFILLLTVLATFNSYAQIPAFPGAEGYGKYTVGGRGGTIYEVTNLNDSGSGSFREACEASGARTVIFKVGGRINLINTIRITNPNITIAGQTAPGDGIMISKEGSDKPALEVDASEVIIRHIRFRRSTSYAGGNNSDNVWVASGHNIIFDHCSFAWSSDGNLDFADYTDSNYDAENPVPPPAKIIYNITVQYCLFTNSYGGSNKTMLVSRGPSEISFFRNAWLSTATRNPAVSTPVNEAPRWDSYFEHINNFHYDYTNGPSFNNNDMSSDAGIFYVNVIGNRAKENNNGSGVPPTVENGYSDRRWLRAATMGNDMGIFVENNITPYRPNDTYDEWEIGQNSGGQADRDILIPENLRSYSVINTPIVMDNVVLWEPNDVWDNLRTHVGASLPARDSEDARAVNDVDTGNSTEDNTLNTFPIVNNGTPYNDIDNDGMDDLWEMSEYGNLDSDGIVDTDGDGYTDLEEYLNQTSNGSIPDIPAENVLVAPNSATLNIPDTVVLSTTFTPENTLNKNGVWSSTDSSIATVDSNGIVTSISVGVAVITFTSDSGGFTGSAEITVTDITIPLESVILNPTDITIEIGETSEVTTVFMPVNTTDELGTWISSDESIVSVDSNGMLTSVNEGLAQITYTSNNTGLSGSSNITVIDTFFGTYDLYNAATDELIQNIVGDTDINLADEGNEINFRSIPEGGDENTDVESVKVDWTGPTAGTWVESGAIYAGLPNGHLDLNFESYVVEEGTYNFTVTYYSEDDATGDVVAVDKFSLTFFFDSLPNANAGVDQDMCEGDTIILTASGGPNFSWNSGENTAVIEVSPSETTTYFVIVSDDDGNTDEDSVTVTVNSIPLANAGEDQTICLGQSATLVATGGVSYLWNTGETTASIEVNPSVETSYSVEVSNENCSSIDEVTVFVAEIPNITISEDIVIIESETTTLTATGGENYEWSTGETTESIEVNPTETTIYTVSSVSENGCVSSANVTVTVIAEIIADAGEDITICNGEFVTLSASGGSTYLWNTGDSGSELIINPTITTTYTVTVEDEYGYTKDDSVTVFVNESPNITVGDDVFIMIGDSTTLTANGGNNFVWSTGETTNEISVSPDVTTTYIVTGFSENGCQNTAEVTVTVVEELNANAGEDVSICLGESVTLNASGGITYIWNTGGSGATPTVTPTETTTYTVTITDGFGNSDTDDIIVTVNPLPIANAGENQTICVGEFVNLTAEGGDTYLWSTGETTANITVNPNEDTIYTVETFSNNCSDSADVTVFVSTMPEVVVSEDVTIVTGSSTTLLVSGGDSYLWNTGDTSNSIEVSPIETTTYSVTGFSANGCQSVAEVTVTVIAEVNADAGNDVAICFGESVTLNASGGINYTWSTGEAGASLTLSPTETTTYTVTVTDSFGNSDTDSVTVIVNELPTITISESITIIEGDSTNLLVSGAESYLWNTGDTSNSILVSPSQTTTYSVVGTTNSCSSELKEVTVKVTPLFRASAGTDERVCDNQNYEVVLTANEGDSYLWSTGETSQSIVVNPLSTSTYSVTVTQGDQSDTDDVKVYVDPSPVVTIANGESVEILSGDFVTLSASGANTYRWNNGASQPNIAVSPSITTTYEIKGFIGECYDEKQVTVNVLNRVTADAGEDVFACLEDVSTLTASGGDDYIWSTGETTQTIEVSPTETTDYTVTVFNALDFDEATVRVEVDVNCGIDSTNPVEEETEFAFDVYPNPASGIVNVKISGSLIVSDINIFDVTGKLVQYIKITNENLNPSTTTQVDISSLQAGVYFIKLNNKDRNITKKLIVK
ncbi:T9SS type A sorting domain-containing protein [Winogradskyella pacifica]|uniref:T9SS type A sorting domain-containing protein n=1 Tax=Winogradskyella pacifica TaxID=664642 RepID=UPI0015CAE3B6|nr:Ig-like domain-containing protein [Winogradskyella pacifica]